MPPKKGKGQKMGLGEFYQQYGGPDNKVLPEAPRPRDEASGDRWGDRRPPRDYGDRGDREDRPRFDRDRGDRDPDEPSRADEADQWRRPGGAERRPGPGGYDRPGFDRSGPGGYDRPQRPSFRDRDDAEAGPSAADESSAWRRDKEPAARGPAFGGSRPPMGGSSRDRYEQGSSSRDRYEQRLERPADAGDPDAAPWRRDNPAAPTGRPPRDDSSAWRPRNDDQGSAPGGPGGPGGYKRLNLQRKGGPANAEGASTPTRPDGAEASPEKASEAAEPSRPAEEPKAAAPVEAAQPAAPAAPEPAPAPKPVKSKKIDPNAKIDPFGGARAKQPETVVEPAPVRPAGKATAAPANAPAGDSKKSAGAAPAATSKAAAGKPAAAAPVRKDPELDEKFVNLKKQNVNPITEAIKAKSTVSDSDLVENFGKMNLNDADSRTGSIQVLTSSLNAGTVTLAAVATAMKGRSLKETTTVLTSVLENVKAAKGEAGLAAVVKDSQVDLNSLLDTFSKELAFLNPSTAVTTEVGKALADNKSTDEVLSLIKNSVDEKVDPAFLTNVVAEECFRRAYAGGKELNITVLDSFAPLLKHVLQRDRKARVDALLVLHDQWAKNGGARGLVKKAFEYLLDKGIIPDEAFVAWKDDTGSKKANGKQKALIETVAWVGEVEAKMQKKRGVTAEKDEEEDENEELDEYLINHNRET